MTHGESTYIVVTAYVYSIGDIPWSILYMPTSVVTPSLVVSWTLYMSECSPSFTTCLSWQYDLT